MPRRFRLASQARITYSGRLSTSCFPSGVFTWPNLVATTTPSRRPRSALPSSVSLCPQPYMSAESRKLMPRLSAWWMTPIDSSSFALPYTPDMDIRPRPTAETLMPLRPSGRCCITSFLNPEIALLDIVACREVGRAAAPDHPAFLQHIVYFRDASQRLHVLVDDENRQPFGLQPLDRAVDLRPYQRRETLGRFVEDQQPRIGHQRPADGEHLLLAA